MQLTISTPPGATLRCTMDGSEPRSDSPVCGDTIEIQRNVRLRARSFAPGMLPSFTASADIRIDRDPPQASFCAPSGDYALICLSHAAGKPVKADWTIGGETAIELLFQPGELVQIHSDLGTKDTVRDRHTNIALRSPDKRCGTDTRENAGTGFHTDLWPPRRARNRKNGSAGIDDFGKHLLPNCLMDRRGGVPRVVVVK